MPPLLRYVLATALLASGLLASAPTANAYSCARSPGLLGPSARAAFTGRVVDRERNRILVRVDEVWQGGPVNEEVWLTVEVLAGDSKPWSPEQKLWLYSPHEAPGGAPTVNQCNAWPITKRLVEKARPATVTAPVDATSKSPERAAAFDAVHNQTDPGPWILVGLAFAGAGALVVLLVSFHRRRD